MGGPVVTRRSPKHLDPDAEALAKGTNELNAKLARAEEKLAAFGVEGAVEIETSTVFTHLAFRKLSSHWRLVLENFEELHVLAELSRELRVAGALKVPELVEVLRQRVREERARVEAANNALDGVLGDEEAVDDIPF